MRTWQYTEKTTVYCMYWSTVLPRSGHLDCIYSPLDALRTSDGVLGVINKRVHLWKILLTRIQCSSMGCADVQRCGDVRDAGRCCRRDPGVSGRLPRMRETISSTIATETRHQPRWGSPSVQKPFPSYVYHITRWQPTCALKWQNDANDTFSRREWIFADLT